MKFETLIENLTINERMSVSAKRKMKKYLRTPKAKKAKRKRERCEAKHKDKLKKTEGKSHAFYCSSEGKLKRSDKTKQDLKRLKRNRERNQNKITVR